MSCAHTFGMWCPECIDSLVQDYNMVRTKLAEASEINQMSKERDVAVRGWESAASERDRAEHDLRQAREENAKLRKAMEKLPRLTQRICDCVCGPHVEFDRDPDGDYVRWSDIEEAFFSTPVTR